MILHPMSDLVADSGLDMQEGTSIPRVLGAGDGETPSFGGTGIGPIELRAYGEAWRGARRFRRDLGGGADRLRPARAGGFAGLMRSPADDDDDTGFEENASREGCPPSPVRIAAALLLARAFDAAPDAARDLVSGGAPVVVDVADGTMLDALKGAWRGIFFDDAARMIDLVRTAPGRRSGLDGAYVVLKEPLKASAKQRLERVAADMCGYTRGGRPGRIRRSIFGRAGGHGDCFSAAQSRLDSRSWRRSRMSELRSRLKTNMARWVWRHALDAALPAGPPPLHSRELCNGLACRTLSAGP